MCKIYVVTQDNYLKDDKKWSDHIENGVTGNWHGSSAVLLDREGNHSIVRVSEYEDLKLMLDNSENWDRALIHHRWGTGNNLGVIDTHFWQAGRFLYCHNGVFRGSAKSDKLRVDSQAIGVFLEAGELWEAIRFCQEQEYANVLIVDIEGKRYYMTRSRTNSLYTDGAGQYSTDKLDGLCDIPVSQSSIVTHPFEAYRRIVSKRNKSWGTGTGGHGGYSGTNGYSNWNRGGTSGAHNDTPLRSYELAAYASTHNHDQREWYLKGKYYKWKDQHTNAPNVRRTWDSINRKYVFSDAPKKDSGTTVASSEKGVVQIKKKWNSKTGRYESAVVESTKATKTDDDDYDKLVAESIGGDPNAGTCTRTGSESNTPNEQQEDNYRDEWHKWLDTQTAEELEDELPPEILKDTNLYLRVMEAIERKDWDLYLELVVETDYEKKS